MSNWGGIVAAGLVGGAIGAGQVIKEDAVEREKIAAQAQRDALLSKLRVQEHQQMGDADQARKLSGIGPEAAAKADAAVATLPQTTKVTQAEVEAKRKGEIAAEGGVRITSGTSIVDPDTGEIKMTGPKAEEDPELKAAKIDELKARAEASRSLANKRDSDASKVATDKSKPATPKWQTNADNKSEAVDEVTGIVRTMVPAEEAVPAKSGFWANITGSAREGTPAKPMRVKYTSPEGIELTPEEYRSIYPAAIAKRDTSILDSKGTEAGSSTPKKSAGSLSIPSGSQYLGRSPDGRKIYKTPDGRTLAE